MIRIALIKVTIGRNAGNMYAKMFTRFVSKKNAVLSLGKGEELLAFIPVRSSDNNAKHGLAWISCLCKLKEDGGDAVHAGIEEIISAGLTALSKKTSASKRSPKKRKYTKRDSAFWNTDGKHKK